MTRTLARDVRRLLAAAAALLALGCTDTSAFVGPLPGGGHHVLFIGNSLTAVNSLPEVVAAIAASAGDTIRVASETIPGSALIDHLELGRAQPAIRADRWQFVVLQQGPSSLPANRDSLVMWTQMFAPLIRDAGARPALLMVWPSSDRLAYLDDVRESYQAAARAVNGVFLPAGEAWRTAWATDPALPLYGSDGFHPSELGTFLAALVVYERVTGHDARALPAEATMGGGYTLEVPPETVRLLQRAAHETNARFATR
jgi:hypothetical protein